MQGVETEVMEVEVAKVLLDVLDKKEKMLLHQELGAMVKMEELGVMVEMELVVQMVARVDLFKL